MTRSPNNFRRFTSTLTVLAWRLHLLVLEVCKTETFARWLDELSDIRARARVQVGIERLAAGNPGDVRPVGGVRTSTPFLKVVSALGIRLHAEAAQQ